MTRTATATAVTIRPWASNLIEQGCEAGVCSADTATWAISHPGKRFTETTYACDDHVGPLAGSVAKRVNG